MKSSSNITLSFFGFVTGVFGTVEPLLPVHNYKQQLQTLASVARANHQLLGDNKQRKRSRLHKTRRRPAIAAASHKIDLDDEGGKSSSDEKMVTRMKRKPGGRKASSKTAKHSKMSKYDKKEESRHSPASSPAARGKVTAKEANDKTSKSAKRGKIRHKARPWGGRRSRVGTPIPSSKPSLRPTKIFDPTLSPTFATPQVKLAAIDGAPGDGFGDSVAIYNDIAIVGAPGKGTNGDLSGSVYVFLKDVSFQKDNGVAIDVSSQRAKIRADDGVAGDGFGRSVGIYNNTIVVGAFNTDGSNDSNGAAYVFRNDGLDNWSQQDKIVAADGATGDAFGLNVAIFDDTVIVGTGGDEAAYIFEKNETDGWTEEAKLEPNEIPSVKLVANDGTTGDRFGESVATYRDIAIFGAPSDGEDGGSAYIFEYWYDTAGNEDGSEDEESGYWSQQAKLEANDGGAGGGCFGDSVAIYDNTAVIGAYCDDNGKGSAYVFTKEYGEDNWSQKAKLVARDGEAGDNFGFSVGIGGYGTNIVIGSRYDDDKGSAYVFTKDNKDDWLLDTKLVADDGTVNDHFGWSVGVYDGRECGITVAIGAWSVGDAGGSAYIFGKNDCSGNDEGDWVQQAKLTPEDEFSIYFGYSVAIFGNTAVVGAYRSNDAKGSAYIFVKRRGSDWRQEAKLVAMDGAAEDRFGYSVGIYDNYVTIGAPGSEISERRGSAYVFLWDYATGWSQQSKLYGVGDDGFGRSVGINRHRKAIVSSPGDDDSTGSAYVFSLPLVPPSPTQAPEPNTFFPTYSPSSTEVPEPGPTTIGPTPLSAPSPINTPEPSPTHSTTPSPIDTPAPSPAPAQVARLLSEDRSPGGSVAIYGRTAILGGTRGDSGNGRRLGLEEGVVYIFVNDGNNFTNEQQSSSRNLQREIVWREKAKLVAEDGEAGDNFGHSVGIHGDTVIVGAYGDDGNRGSVYIFVEGTNGVWYQQAKLVAKDGEAGDEFGGTVGIDGNRVIVGAWRNDDGKGSAYIFERDEDDNWYQQRKLGADDGVANDQFGRSGVGFQSDTAVVGAPYDNDQGNSSGAAYIFIL